MHLWSSACTASKLEALGIDRCLCACTLSRPAEGRKMNTTVAAAPEGRARRRGLSLFLFLGLHNLASYKTARGNGGLFVKIHQLPSHVKLI